MRVCAWCQRELSPSARGDAITCSQSCRQARARFRIAIRRADQADRPLRLAYADPPYRGKARRYYGNHPDFAGEVDHAELVSRLATFDGWALSCSAESLPYIVSCLAGVDGWRIGAWYRGGRPGHKLGPVAAWEPVIYRPARSVVSIQVLEDAFGFVARPRRTDPRRVVGAKPAAFADWLFGLLSARRGDTLDDLFPGSGGIGRAWEVFQEAA